jgi:AcrR family transcriptional regulator
MRADAQKNYDHILAVARDVVAEQGADASLRDIARRAGVGLGTLYRHFPTREALLEALLRTGFDELTARAGDLETSRSHEDALVSWLGDFVAGAHKYRGVAASMMTAIEDSKSALHASCVRMKTAGAQLLARAQAEGMARNDIDGADLFALAAALAWLGDQPSHAPRADHLFGVIASAILTTPGSSGVSQERRPRATLKTSSARQAGHDSPTRKFPSARRRKGA